MSKLDLVFLNGIPYLVGTDGNVYTYEVGPEQPVHIGTWNRTSGEFNLHADWRDNCKKHYAEWHRELSTIERGKVRATFKAPKSSKSRKNTGSS